jgi:hypothetical protein
MTIEEGIDMASISRESAQELFDVLDKEVGFFLVEEMSDRALSIREKKCDEFFDSLTTDIPAVTWFQGQKVASVELHFDSNGFRLYGNPEVLHNREAVLLENVNEMIHDLHLEVKE